VKFKKKSSPTIRKVRDPGEENEGLAKKKKAGKRWFAGEILNGKSDWQKETKKHTKGVGSN